MMNKYFIKNIPEHKTKTLDHDSLVSFLAHCDYDLIQDIMDHTYSEVLYFAILGYKTYNEGGVFK